MTKIFILSTLIAIIFTGCSQKSGNTVPNYTIKQLPETSTTGIVIENVTEDGTTYKVNKTVEGMIQDPAFAYVTPVMIKAIEHAKLKGYRYIQIIAPDSLSNEKGFPINNTADLASYIAPYANNTGGFLGLENSINKHSSLDGALTIFGQSTFQVVIKEVKNPKYDDIVWNTQDYK